MENERFDKIINKYQRIRNKLDIMWDNSMYLDGPITYHNMITEAQNVIYCYTDLLSEYLPDREIFYEKQQLYLSSLCELLKSYVPLHANDADVNDGLNDPLVSTLMLDLNEFYFLTCKAMDENIKQGTFEKETSGYQASRPKIISFADKHDVSAELDGNEFAELNKRREFVVIMKEMYDNFFKFNEFFFEKACEQSDDEQAKESRKANKIYDDAFERQRKFFENIIEDFADEDIATLDHLGGLADILSGRLVHFLHYFGEALTDKRERARIPEKLINLHPDNDNPKD